MGITIAAAQNQPSGFLRRACIKVQPGKFSEFMQFANGPGVKFVQAIVDSGELTASTFLRSVVPAGDEARCDFIQVDAFKGIPGGPLSKEQLAAVMQKSGVGMTPEQFMAKRESLARLVSMEYWRTQISVGDIQKGDYLYINSMKVPNMADYRKVEETVWKPMAEEWVKNGRMPPGE